MKLSNFSHNLNSSPIGKISKRYLRLLALPCFLIIGFYIANQIYDPDESEIQVERQPPPLKTAPSHVKINVTGRIISPPAAPQTKSKDVAAELKPKVEVKPLVTEVKEKEVKSMAAQDKNVTAPGLKVLVAPDVVHPVFKKGDIGPNHVAGRITYQTGCQLKTWKSVYTLTDYKLPPKMTCHGDSCSLNSGREPIKVDQTKLKHPCDSIESCITVIVKTENRFNITARLINSLHFQYPKVNVVVADNSPNATDEKELKEQLTNPDLIRYHATTFGKPHKVSAWKVSTPYVLVLEDDHVLLNHSRLLTLLDILQHTDASVAGEEQPNDYKRHFQGVLVFSSEPNTSRTNLEIYNNVFHQIVKCYAGCYVADMVKNNYLVDKDIILNSGAWDFNLDGWDQQDFFCTLRKKNIKVVYCGGSESVPSSPDGILKKRTVTPPRFFIFKKWQISGYHVCTNPDSYHTDPVCPLRSRKILD